MNAIEYGLILRKLIVEGFQNLEVFNVVLKYCIFINKYRKKLFYMIFYEFIFTNIQYNKTKVHKNTFLYILK